MFTFLFNFTSFGGFDRVAFHSVNGQHRRVHDVGGVVVGFFRNLITFDHRIKRLGYSFGIIVVDIFGEFTGTLAARFLTTRSTPAEPRTRRNPARDVRPHLRDQASGLGVLVQLRVE